MAFRNSVVGGTTLVRAAIRSPNYVAGVSGWSINRDGSAEFSDIVIRGAASGDSVIIGPDSGSQVRIGFSAAEAHITFPMHSPKENFVSQINAAVFNSGAANESLSLQIRGPSVDDATDRLELLLNSQNNDGTSQANMVLRLAGGSSGTLLSIDKTAGFTLSRHAEVSTTSTTSTGLIVDNPSGGTANILSLQKNGSTLVNVASTGALTMDPSSTSAVPAIINAPSGQTADLLQLKVNATTRALLAADGRLSLITTASANAGISLETELAHTGALIRLRNDSTDKFVVNTSGILTTYAANAFTTYTPTVTGGGTATFTTQTGWWVRAGKMIFFTAYLVVNAAGSGATAVSIDGPVSIDRSTRQSVPVQADNITPANEGSCCLVSFTGGTGATFDRLRDFNNNNVTGVDLLSAAIITATGWYREA